MINPPLSEQLAARLRELYPAHEWKAETREGGEYILLGFLEAKLTIEREGTIPDVWVSGLGAAMIKAVSEAHEIDMAFWKNKIDGNPTGQPIGILSKTG